MNNSVNLTVCGTTIRISTDEKSEYARMLAGEIEKSIKEHILIGSNPFGAAVFTALKLLDENLKLKKKLFEEEGEKAKKGKVITPAETECRQIDFWDDHSY